jgi:peptide/nickel transport system substrate-binding protein
VLFRSIIANDQSRVAALLAGDVDVIDFVAPADVDGLRKNPRTQVFQRSSDRVIYLVADVGREPTPYVTDKQGKPLPKNPLKDLRVRQAISKAINRPLMVERVMEGLASAAGQLVPEGFLGYSPNLKVEPYDPEGARKLLAAAGYPDGFALTIHGPNDRYMNDEKVTQAAAQMLSRVGIQAKVEVMTKQIYFGKINPPNGEYSMMLLGWGSSATGESSHTLPALFHSYDRARGMGFSNNGNYSNPALDKLVVEAIATVDRGQREKKLWQAMEMAINDLLVIPLHNQFTVMATRKGFTYIPRADEYTLAMNTKPAP